MTEPLHVPKAGCSTCPYRRDTPAGVWHPDEYAKLALYDEQPYERGVEPRPLELSTFHCHQQNATGQPTVCRGWLSVHADSVAVRLACARGALSFSDVPEAPEALYYETGAQAAAAGLSGVAQPSVDALKAMERLERRGAGKASHEHARRGQR